MDQRLYRFLQRIYPPPLFMNTGGRLSEFMDKWPPPSRVLEVGAGKQKRREDIIGLDIQLEPNLDLVAKAEVLPIRSGVADALFSIAVLEHVEDAQATAAEVFRVLRAGGEVYVEIPFMARYHDCPNDYRRLTLSGLQLVFREFEEIESGVCVGPAAALAELSQEFAASFTDSIMTKKAIRFAAGWLLQPLKLLDLYLAKKKTAHLAAYGVYFWGRKPEKNSD